MKKICGFLTAGLLASSINAFAGGVAGGGGGVLISEPVSLSDAHFAVAEARLTVLAWLKGLESQYAGQRNCHTRAGCAISEAVLQKLFAGPTDVFQVAEHLVIEEHQHGACPDTDGNDRDGSIKTQTAGAICISSARLSQKLSRLDLVPQTDALILHEITHLMGGDEDEAVMIQKAALADLPSDADKIVSRVNHDIASKVLNVAVDAQIAREQLSEGPALQAMVNRISSDLVDIDSTATPSNLSPFREAVAAQVFRNFYWRSQALETYVCTINTQKEADVRQWCNEAYDAGFKGQESVEAQEYACNRDHTAQDHCEAKPVEASMVIKKIHSPSDLDSELNEIRQYFLDLSGQPPMNRSSAEMAENFQIIKWD